MSFIRSEDARPETDDGWMIANYQQMVHQSAVEVYSQVVAGKFSVAPKRDLQLHQSSHCRPEARRESMTALWPREDSMQPAGFIDLKHFCR